MIKKLNIICVVILSLSLVGCSFPSSEDIETTSKTEEVTTVEETTTIPVEVLSDEMINNITTNTSKYKSVNVSQKSYSFGIVDGKREDEKCIATTSLEVDLKSKILFTDVIIDMNSGDTHYYFVDNYKKNIHINKVGDGKYIQDKKETSASLTIDCSKMNNAYQFISTLCNNNFPVSGIEGILDDNVYTFTLVRNATETDIANIEYDKLRDTTLVYKINKDSEGNLLLSGVDMTVTFYIGNIVYGVQTICEFKDYSNNKLKMPKYVKLKSKKKNKKKGKK